MKRLVIAVSALIAIAVNAHADSPVEKDVFSLSGSISYTRPNGGGGRNISVTPSSIYFVYPNIALGASVLYSDIFQENAYRTVTYGIGPIIRYYFGNDAIYPFASAQYIYTKKKYDITSGFKIRGRGRDVSLGLGVDYFLAKNVAIEPIITYNFNYDRDSSSTTGTSVNRREDLTIAIGVNVFIY